MQESRKHKSVKEGRVKVGFELTSDLQKQIVQAAKEEGFNDQAEFIRAAVREKIERWKKEHSSGYGSPERVKKEE